MSRKWWVVLFSSGAAAVAACAERIDGRAGSLIGSPADPSPTVAFTQNAVAVGLSRSNEPASASSCTDSGGFGTLAYGTYFMDLDGDGRLDVYDVNHGQGCHLSGLWLNDGAGHFGKNLFSVAMNSAATNGVTMSLTNQVVFSADVTGDGRIDTYFATWSGGAALCVNQGNAAHSDWTGPSFLCYGSQATRSFGDVNGDGKLDIEILDPATAYDVYKDYCRTLPTIWKLNNGNPDIGTWPTDNNTFHFVGLAAPGALLDFNKDGIPDKIQGVEVGASQRGPFSTLSGGLRVSLGQANGTYQQVTSGLENVHEPVVLIEDVDEDGCPDVGTDATGYKGNLDWYVQDRSVSTCLATFHAVARTALPYFPGARHYALDVDNDGLIDRAVIVHIGVGNNEIPGGVHIFRKLPSGAYQDLGAAGVNIFGSDPSEFYADELNPGDWNGDGKLDLAGAGNPSIAGSDAGSALWTSALSTTNNWIKVQTPTVTGFFTGASTIEIFDAGFAGDPAHLVTPPLSVRTGFAWPGRSYHFGVGQRGAIDVKVTFPDGGVSVATAVAVNTTVSVQPVANVPPVASPAATPSAVVVGQAVAFDGSASTDPDGTIVAYAWTFGDGASASAATASHAYAAPGTFAAALTVRDNAGSTSTTSVSIEVSDVQPPTAPGGLTAAVFSATQINLGWTASVDDVGVTAYLVERCQGAGCSDFAQIASTAGLSLGDTGLSSGTSYRYRVRATDGSGNASAYSATASATTVVADTQPPTAPATLTATAASSTQVNLAWAAASDDVGVASYLVERCQGAGCTSFAQIGTTAGTTFSSTGLTASTAYVFRVRATDTSGNAGPYSPTAAATTFAVPANPTFVQQNSTCPQSSPTTVTLSFAAAQAAGDLNVVIVGWSNSTSQITSVTDAAGNGYALAAGPTAISGVASQAIYYAKNIAAAGAGNTVTVRFNTGAPFPDVRILQYHGLDGTSPLEASAVGQAGSGTTTTSAAVVTANPVDLLVAGNYVGTTTTAAGTGYTARVFTNPDGDIAEDRVVTAAGSYTASATLGSSGYWVMQLVAFRAGPGVPDTTPPTAPSNLTATAASSTQINLAWTAATDNVGVAQYAIERCQGAGCSSFAQVGTAAGTSFSNTGLTAGTSYSYRVRATDAAGNLGPFSSTATATTPVPDTTPPTAPSGLTATAASSSQINLAWTAATDDVGVTQYLVERCQGAGCSSFAQIATVTGTTFSNTGLAASTSFSYRVRAQDAAGNLGPYSSTATATTPAATANPTFVQRSFTCPQSAVSSVAVAFASAQAAGDLNVVIIGWSDTTSQITAVTDGAGNSYALAVGPTRQSGLGSQSIYYAKNIAASAAGNTVTVTFSAAAPFPDLRILQYHGLDPANPLDVTAAGTGTNGTAMNSGSATTTGAVDLLVGANYVETITQSAGANFASRVITTPDGDIAEDRVVTTAGSFNATATLASSGRWIMQMVAFRR